MNQVGATFVIGVIAAAIAIWGILTQRAIARQRATFDHITNSQADADMIEARQKFIQLAKENGGLAKWSGEEHEKTTEVQAIKLVLNDFELIAIGIQRGIIDLEFYKRWHRSGVVLHWNYARPFVAALRTRTGNEMLFHEFEQLAGWFTDNKPPQRKLRFWDKR
jgi:hypothetical protein